jgi:hypothetical protein
MDSREAYQERTDDPEKRIDEPEEPTTREQKLADRLEQPEIERATITPTLAR